MSIHGDVQFIGQLKYKTHVAVIEKFTFMTTGAEPDIFIWGALEGPVLQQGELSMVCVGLSERDLIFGGPGKILGGQWPPGTLLSPPLYD